MPLLPAKPGAMAAGSAVPVAAFVVMRPAVSAVPVLACAVMGPAAVAVMDTAAAVMRTGAAVMRTGAGVMGMAADGALVLAWATLPTMATMAAIHTRAIMLHQLPITATTIQRLLTWRLATATEFRLSLAPFGLARDFTAAATTPDIGGDVKRIS